MRYFPRIIFFVINTSCLVNKPVYENDLELNIIIDLSNTIISDPEFNFFDDSVMLNGKILVTVNERLSELNENVREDIYSRLQADTVLMQRRHLVESFLNLKRTVNVDLNLLNEKSKNFKFLGIKSEESRRLCNHFIYFSTVCYNNELNEGCFYYEYINKNDCGAGVLVFFNILNNRAVFDETCLLWIV